MMSLYFQGYTEIEIAQKLGVDQSTVSKNTGKFKSLIEQQGIESAGKEFGIMDQVVALHSLASELKKAKLTVEEAKVGCKMVTVFQGCGIQQEDYPDLVQACTKMKSEGMTKAAVELNQLEKATGKAWNGIVTEAVSANQGIEQAHAQAAIIADKLKSSQEQLTAIENQKKLADQDLIAHLEMVDTEKKKASDDLADHMKQVGVDMGRLALVEDLAMALKEGSVSDTDLELYIKHQKHLDQSGISLNNLVTIVNQAKVMTKDDKGKILVEKLSQFSSLDAAIGAHHNKISLLTQETAGLEEKAKVKAKIEADIVKLQAERTTNETVVTELAMAKKDLDKAQHNVTDLLHQQAALVQDIKQKQESLGKLDEEIVEKEQKVIDLGELEAKRNAVLATLAELEAQKEINEMEWKVFESFLGIVGSSLSMEAINKLADTVPQLFAFAKIGEYSPELLRSVIIKDLSGGTLEILRCISCQARFSVDKPVKAPHQGYRCPLCGSGVTVQTEVNGPEIINKALAMLAPHTIVVTPVTSPKGIPHKNSGEKTPH